MASRITICRDLCLSHFPPHPPPPRAIPVPAGGSRSLSRSRSPPTFPAMFSRTLRRCTCTTLFGVAAPLPLPTAPLPFPFPFPLFPFPLILRLSSRATPSRSSRFRNSCLRTLIARPHCISSFVSTFSTTQGLSLCRHGTRPGCFRDQSSANGFSQGADGAPSGAGTSAGPSR
ncbi:hypothetical protein FIBSPDRAFT_880144 [Athelia psychrophila]|uniref:Uncharacterized protein n=1 Tax=Athelia psychrophila TaxID=1759441 RepID=A0A167T7N0_9AGAM|nr:hypothetical protein FIBSPDRAFT_880144 [Fibularhizoctonia sp. CBS 109695]